MRIVRLAVALAAAAWLVIPVLEAQAVFCPAGSMIVSTNGNWSASSFRVDECVDGGSANQTFDDTTDTRPDCVADQVYGEGGADQITMFCQNGSNAGVPSEADGQAGNDTVVGSDAQDLLFGGAGGDTISGHNGNDVIHDGSGFDTLSGNGGSDLLCFAADNNNDENLATGFESMRPEGDAACTQGT